MSSAAEKIRNDALIAFRRLFAPRDNGHSAMTAIGIAVMSAIGDAIALILMERKGFSLARPRMVI